MSAGTGGQHGVTHLAHHLGLGGILELAREVDAVHVNGSLALHEGRRALVPVEVDHARRPILPEEFAVHVDGGHLLLRIEGGLAVLQVRAAHRKQDARVLGGVGVLEPAEHDAVGAGRRVELLHERLEVGKRLGRREILRAEEVLAIEEHVGIDEGGEGGDAAVGLGHAGARARGKVVPVEVGAGQGRVLQELVQGMVPARLPEALLLDMERGEEGVDPARVRRHLYRHLLAGLDLRQRLPLDLHPRERLELRDVLLEHIDEGVLGQHQEELLALEALPVEALRLRRREDEGSRGGACGRGGKKGAAGQSASGHLWPPLMR